MRNKVINIAVAEIDYKEGAGNSNKYSKELYNSKGQEWCNDFVCWVMRKAGIGTDIVPAYSYVPSTAEWFDKKGQYKNSKAKGGDYTPQKGDITLFDYNRNNTSDHIGLVEKVENGKVHTIEGNKDNMVKRCVYDINSKDIRAYCVPAYPENKKSVEEVAQEIATKDDFGGWGVYPKRKELLEEAGYNYNEVQARVNKILKQSKTKTVYKTVSTRTNNGVNIRAKATTNSGRIGGAEEGAKVQVLEENVAKSDGYLWDKIKYKNITGYVANAYLK